MGAQVVMGAMLQCSFGLAPSSLVVLPQNNVMAMVPAANILDNKPIANIPPFGMCTSPANPMVIAATAAALGVPVPMPCIPATVAPWVPGSTRVTIGKMPALDSNCKLMCIWGGVIQIVSPGQVKVIDA